MNSTEENVGVLTETIYAYLIEGSIAVLLNVPLALTMIAVKAIRIRREFQVIIGLAITDVAFGAAFILSGIDRYLEIRNVRAHGPSMVLRSDCNKKFEVQLLTISYQLQGILSLTVAFDRLLAIAIPLRYIKFDRFYNYLIIAIPTTVVLIPTSVNFILTMFDHTRVSSLCLTSEAVYPGFHLYVLLMRIVCILSSGFIYVYIVSSIRQKFNRIEIGRHRLAKTQFRSTRHSTVTVGLTTVNAILFLLVPDVLAVFEIGGLHKKYATILYSFYAVNVNLNFVILITRHKEIRHTLWYFIRTVIFRQPPRLPHLQVKGATQAVSVVLPMSQYVSMKTTRTIPARSFNTQRSCCCLS